MSYKDKICSRAAQEIEHGSVINLGVGIPTLISKYISAEKSLIVHSENGIVGMGKPCSMQEADRDLIDAGGTYVHLEKGASFVDSAVSFALIRSGRLDIAVLGALELDASGNLANWIMPGGYTPGIGGAMELAQKANRLLVTTSHCTRKGEPKIVKHCTLPITARACVNTVITELAVIDVTDLGLELRALSRDTTLEEVLDKTDAHLYVPDKELEKF